MTEKRKPILCLDFDGVVHSYSSGWKGPDIIPDPPVPGAFKFIRQASNHFDVQVFSSRSGYAGAITAMKKWFHSHDPFAVSDTPIIDLIHFPREKPPAQVSIDDRAMLFTGTWPNPAMLLEFKPWNKLSGTQFSQQQMQSIFYSIRDSFECAKNPWLNAGCERAECKCMDATDAVIGTLFNLGLSLPMLPKDEQ